MIGFNEKQQGKKNSDNNLPKIRLSEEDKTLKNGEKRKVQGKKELVKNGLNLSSNSGYELEPGQSIEFFN